MAYVVTDICTKCTKCVDVCPANCFHEDENMLVIDPETCISCGACAGECPVNAIFAEEEVQEKYKDFIVVNANKSKMLPPITESPNSQ